MTRPKGSLNKEKKRSSVPVPTRISADLNEVLLYLVEIGEDTSRNALINKILEANIDVEHLKPKATAFFAAKNLLITKSR